MTTATKITTKKPAPMNDIYARLEVFGLKKKWLRDRILPEWWNDELARTPSARSEIEIYLAQTLGLELSTLRDPNATLRFAQAPRARFKRHAGSCEEKLQLARALGARLGALAVAAFPQTSEVATSHRLALSALSAQSIRAEIIESGAPWIGLDELLSFCFARGVAVLHATLPDGCKCCDGMALSPGGRPAILSFNERHSPAWQAFIVAHELGHHVLGHIGINGEIFDNQLRRSDKDEEESAANEFAARLLTGVDGFNYNKSWPEAAILAREVARFGATLRVHPGVLLLNLCHHKPKMRALAMSALNLVENGADAFASYARAATHFDDSVWNDDEAAFFERLATVSIG